jgi:sugar phosphate isomerase/epimerase
MIQIRQWCQRFDLKVKGIHATDGVRRKRFDLANPGEFFERNSCYYISQSEPNRLAGVELIRNRIDLAYMLNAGYIVLHCKQPWEVFEVNPMYQQRFYEQLGKSFKELQSYCTMRNIRICIEIFELIPPSWTFHQYETLFAYFPADFLGFCFDTGHANMTHSENCLELAERYNNRLFMVHLHDNNGKQDEHHLPFEGTFDWEGFAPLLARSPYNMPPVMEQTSIGVPDSTAWLIKAHEAGTRFFNMVMRYR